MLTLHVARCLGLSASEVSCYITVCYRVRRTIPVGEQFVRELCAFLSSSEDDVTCSLPIDTLLRLIRRSPTVLVPITFVGVHKACWSSLFLLFMLQTWYLLLYNPVTVFIHSVLRSVDFYFSVDIIGLLGVTRWKIAVVFC